MARHTRRKWFSDLLGPLKRWLQSQVGQPWNEAYSEACAVIKPDSPIRTHVKTHLLEFVERNTFMHDGKVCVLDTGYLGKPVPVSTNGRCRSLFFVHPETGLLLPSPRLSKRAWCARDPKPPATIRWIRRGVGLQQIRGLWFECRFEVVPVDMRFRAYDHALERVVTRGALTRHDKEYCLCILKRQLSKRELRHYGFRNSPAPFSTGAQSSIGRICRRLTTAFQFSAGRRLWVLVNPAIPAQFRSVAFDGGATLSTPGNSTVDFLSAAFLMGRSCGLSHVIGSTPMAGAICRPSSMVEQPPHLFAG
jgi:hypothetical protein